MSNHKSNAPVPEDVQDAQNGWNAFVAGLKYSVIIIAVILGFMAIILV